MMQLTDDRAGEQGNDACFYAALLPSERDVYRDKRPPELQRVAAPNKSDLTAV